MILLTEVLIHCVGIQRTIKIVCGSEHFTSDSDSDTINNAKKVLKPLMLGVRSTAWKGNCLSRSIVLQHLLTKENVSAALFIGVRSKPEFKAHAWVEHKGIPLNAGKKVRQNYQILEDFNIIQKKQFL